MVCKINSVFVFVDLDDTLFQTKRKNSNAIIQATESPNLSTVSYMSEEQNALLNMFKKDHYTKIIPVTARDREQYFRTYISRDPFVEYASLYFGGVIMKNGKIDNYWKKKVNLELKKTNLQINQLHSVLKERLDKKVFLINNIDDYYINIKNKNRLNYTVTNNECVKLINELELNEYFIHHNDNNISIVPKSLDKKRAVEYLIDKEKPILTIGIGDSQSDWGFMDQCDFKIIPQYSQLNMNIRNNFNTNG